jgi:hypothetical protein
MKKRATNPAELYDPRDDMLQELADTIQSLLKENTLLRDKISVGQFDATEVERIDLAQRLEELRKANELLEINNRSLTHSRNWFQNQAAQIIGSRNYWEKQAKKLQRLTNQGGQNV